MALQTQRLIWRADAQKTVKPARLIVIDPERSTFAVWQSTAMVRFWPQFSLGGWQTRRAARGPFRHTLL